MNPAQQFNALLACPVCENNLEWTRKGCRCTNGHFFDLAKEGYINLLLSHQRRSDHPGDDAAMVQARRRFFDSGAFDPLSYAIQKLTLGLKPKAQGLKPFYILDCGCGEGHFLGALRRASLQPGSVGDVAPPLRLSPLGRESLSERADQFFGVDISKEAIRCAAKRYKDVRWIVANGMRKLPFADHSLDLILSILAPRNPEEFARILKPDGALILGVPGPNHLIELRSRLAANAGDFEEKADEAAAKCAPHFKETHRDLLSYQQTLSAVQLADLIQMTPIFWCSSPESKATVQRLDQLTVTVSFVLLTLQRS